MLSSNYQVADRNMSYYHKIDHKTSNLMAVKIENSHFLTRDVILSSIYLL